MSVIDQKKILRKEMLLKRSKLLNPEKKKYDEWVCHSLWNSIKTHQSKKVHCYLPMGSEIDITPLIDKMLTHGITVVTPKTLPKRRLQHLVLASLNQLEKGVFGTSYPANATEYFGSYDLIIVPGLSFNKANYRLGYGGGYYDNFMEQHSNSKKIGICYPFQIVEKIPLETHDLQLDEILVNSEFLEL
ncbi:MULTISPECIES: 5-formyltetrahydrofolate cyclo-ligase [Flavobacteriaceae]|uniref:5-formyltetrahydrofolate cyclo-ligase n=2 Tax=Flavobacteriaceae TaxID=49546 RepID=A0A4Y8ARU1_9FLAO|nr:MULTISPECIES: 5-formyltetrahydrofolate cyclo-ligase [Flavobacteriaceae]TEW73915.1 5-formyltetrahydrofolate cyclo-ligase [Gramella jeungdoensis]GGK38741.1 5-formyltetrahydrofolate cyclo-ligase [Lutibacter litoralis]